ncbi:MAG: UDP-3-O-(3-hydroxymyristoyl)glucosamine N-acyltransferase [Muribaculaceae bacterium]|nr:UDP-3-O-(3-hydroxymyristoyl)glucosamine N-acyltransferase [Muribaculaceae bacterium]MDE7188623.1 UDP-3-O-(3-hydroxymyristoyl)glucosamine N-acyltransferase [Muribaculaceae bacterium]
MEITLSRLAELTGGTIEGSGEVCVTSFAPIEDAREGDLTFLANQKYEHYLYTTRATAVIVGHDLVPSGTVKATLLRVGDPYATLAELMRMVVSMRPAPVGVESPVSVADDVDIPEGAYIGAFAYIGRGVKLGRNVKIYPQVYVGDNVEIGADTVLRAGVRIYEGCRIGERCVLHSGVVIGADGFGFAPTEEGYEKIPQLGNVVIEDDVEIGANTTVDRATFGSTVVGKGTKLDNLIQVAHNVSIGRHNVLAAQVGIAGSAHIGDFNQIGGQVGIAGHIKIGSCNEIGAQSGIPNNVGDHKRLMGYPAIDARQFAKNQVYMKRLDTFFGGKKQ